MDNSKKEQNHFQQQKSTNPFSKKKHRLSKKIYIKKIVYTYIHAFKHFLYTFGNKIINKNNLKHENR